MHTLFKNRLNAGQLLAKRLETFKNKDAVVVAVPKGGVMVAYPVSKALSLPLEIIFSKKIEHPSNKEFFIGVVNLDEIMLDEHKEVSPIYMKDEVSRLRQEIKIKKKLYSGLHKPASLKNKTVILIDDGINTGKTILLSIKALRAQQPASIILAVPILPHHKVKEIARQVDELVYIIAPYDFSRLSHYYEAFEQVTDEEIISYMENIYNNTNRKLNT